MHFFFFIGEVKSKERPLRRQPKVINKKLHHIPIIPSEVCLCTSTGTLPSGTRYWDSFLMGQQG